MTYLNLKLRSSDWKWLVAESTSLVRSESQLELHAPRYTRGLISPSPSDSMEPRIVGIRIDCIPFCPATQFYAKVKIEVGNLPKEFNTWSAQMNFGLLT